MVEHNYQHCRIRDFVSALSLVLLHLAFPGFQQLSRVCARNVPLREQDRLQYSSVPGRSFVSLRVTTRGHTSIALFTRLSCTMSSALSSVNKLRRQYRFVLWAASARVIASCLISNSCRLADPINSPSLGVVAAQHALIMTDHVVHR